MHHGLIQPLARDNLIQFAEYWGFPLSLVHLENLKDGMQLEKHYEGPQAISFHICPSPWHLGRKGCISTGRKYQIWTEKVLLPVGYHRLPFW